MASTHKSLTGRTCLVTGGAGGLGKSVALEFLAAGGNVAICDIDQKHLDTALTELSPQGSTMAVPCDVTDPQSVKNLIEGIISRFGQLDVVVNCAGVMDRFEPVGDLSPGVWNKLLAVNLTGPYLVSKEAVNHFLSRSATDATIINVGSLASNHGWAGGTAYTVSKHGILGLTRSTAAYYKGRGIRCNLVMPGGMNTNIVNEAPFSQEAHRQGQNLLGLVVDALATPISDTKEVAKLFTFLASNDSSALNGALITVDKGQTTVL